MTDGPPSEPPSDPATDPPELDAALAAVERDHDARVLAARDIGSRAWNLAGPDSDHDVAALFVQRPAAYARLDGAVDSVERSAGVVDLTAWNVRRFGELLADSNPTALEFCHSRVVHRSYEPLDALAAHAGESFDPLAVYHHYRSLATRQYRKYIQRRLLDGDDPAYVIERETPDGYLARPVEDPDAPAERITRDRYREGTTDRTVKRALYVVRGVLYAEYVRATGRFPPMDFLAFLDLADAGGGETTADGDDGDTDAGPEAAGPADGFDPDPELVATARDLAERKRAGRGDEPVGDPIGADALPPTRVDPATQPDRGIDRARVDAFIERALADAPDH